MNINISINKIGHATGTIGWLAESAHHIFVGKSTAGTYGAWLQDKDGKTLTILALNEGDGIETVTRCMGEWHLSCDFPATDACWIIVKQLAEIAANAMREDAELAAGFRVTVASLGNHPVSPQRS